MNLDYIVTSLPALSFGEKPAITLDKFIAHLGGEQPKLTDEWCDLETQLRNAVAACRGRPFDARAAHGCAIYWRDRIRECFAENDIFRRDEMIDRVWWDAAGELTNPVAPLGKGALLTYFIRLKIALKRALISSADGNAAYVKLTDMSNQTPESGQR